MPKCSRRRSPIHLEYATPEGDHFGAERENSTSVTLDASYDRINLSALPPQAPDTLSFETRSDLLDRVLPAVDTQLERGASKTEILTPLYESNRELEQLRSYNARKRHIRTCRS